MLRIIGRLSLLLAVVALAMVVVSLLAGSAFAVEPQLTYVAEGTDKNTIWLVDVGRGLRAPLAVLDGQVDGLRWSPDGEQLYFSWRGARHGWRIARLIPGTGDLTFITSLDNTFWPDLSRDGRLIYQHYDEDDISQIFLMDMDTNQREMLYYGGLYERTARPVWSPIAPVIAYEAGLTVGTSDIRLMHVETRQITPLTGTDFAYIMPTWSPDGADIAYARYGASAANLWRLDVASRTPQPLTETVAFDLFPAWSPRGDRIAFISNREPDGQQRIYLINADGTALRLLHQDMQTRSAPAWRPR
ncbi:MAG: hypothetical protein OHK0046_12470 [Anaerolineae bacterium]